MVLSFVTDCVPSTSCLLVHTLHPYLSHSHLLSSSLLLSSLLFSLSIFPTTFSHYYSPFCVQFSYFLHFTVSLSISEAHAPSSLPLCVNVCMYPSLFVILFSLSLSHRFSLSLSLYPFPIQLSYFHCLFNFLFDHFFLSSFSSIFLSAPFFIYTILTLKNSRFSLPSHLSVSFLCI